MQTSGKCYSYVGNWDIPSRAKQGGISCFVYNMETGELSLIETILEHINVGNILIDRERNLIYVTDERDSLPGRKGGGGSVYTMRIDPETGKLTQIGYTPSFGVYPSYLCLISEADLMLVSNHSGMSSYSKTMQDISGQYHIVVDYDESNVVLFERNADGTLGRVCDIKKHFGGSVKPSQEHAHPHSVVSSPFGNLYLVCDKGNDYIYLYEIDRVNKKIVTKSSFLSLLPGSAPRYSAFHPTLPVLYHNNELEPHICVFEYTESGAMSYLEKVSLLPDGHEIKPNLPIMELPSPSDIIVHPNGKYLYATLRVLNRLVVFTIDQEKGTLTRIQNISSGGKNPRAIRIDPQNKFALVTNLDSKEVTVFEIAGDGTLKDTNRRSPAPSPANIAFMYKT